MADPSTTFDPSGKVEITVLKAISLPKQGRHSRDDQFYVKVTLGEQEPQTKNKQRAIFGGNVSWNQTFPFDFHGEMPCPTLEVYGKTFSKRGYDFVGSAKVPYADLSVSDITEVGVSKSHDLPLADKDGKPVTTPKIPTLKISVKTIALGVQERRDDLTPILKQASKALDRLKDPNIPDLSDQAGAAGSAVVSVGAVLEKIGAIADIMGEVTKIHPYAKAAWDILDLTRKVIKAQMQEDDSIRDLSAQMRSLLDRVRTFVEKLDSISPSDIHADEKDILRQVSSTSRGCAEFIISFCEKNFGKRAMKCALFGDASKKIEDFKSKFGSLEKSFNDKVWDGTNIIAHRILENQKVSQAVVDRVDINTQRILDDQTADKYIVSSASLLASNKPSCFTGTRAAIREAITAWIRRDDEDAPRVLLLSGMAGTGKSTIALTIARDCLQHNRLGASFAFSRRAKPRPAPKELFPHIAASLATFYPKVKDVFADKQKKQIASGSDLEGQLRELIVNPLNLSRHTGSNGVIVIVIDALDEADDDGDEAVKLATLMATKCSTLPSNIRILVTSRPETYVAQKMQPPAVLRLPMPDSSNGQALIDVGLFIRDQLKDKKDLHEIDCATLTTTSQGLFQWAATACKEITGNPLRGGSTPRKRYESVVESGVGRDKTGLLDSLYKDVLNRVFPSEDHEVLKRVMTALFAMMKSMAMDAFRKLYVQLELGEESDVDSTLPYLASILDGIRDGTRPVQPNHTSLRDFFLEPGRSGHFCVKDLLPATHNRAARSSFSIVSTSLPQNAYGLDLDRLLRDPESETDRVHRDILPYVVYAILYCVKHLAEAPTPEEAFWINLGPSFLGDDRGLPWIEVFCLLVAHRLGSIYPATPPELSGCIGLLADISKRQGSTCPHHTQSVLELLATIIDWQRNHLFSFVPMVTFMRLHKVHCSVGWTVKLRHQPKDGSSVTIGIGFVLRLTRASHDVVLTTAHNLVDAKGQPHTDLILDIPQQLPRLNGASQFIDAHRTVPSTDIRICAKFPQQPQLETDWGAILLPRGTVLSGGFEFDSQSEDPHVMCMGVYGRPSWTPHPHRLPVEDSGNSVNITVNRAAHVPRLGNPAANGTPIYVVIEGLIPECQVRGICNPTYGGEAYTRLTPALVRELGSWVGLVDKSNTRIRWLPTLPASYSEEVEGAEGVSGLVNSEHLRTAPNRNDLYLFVNEEEDSRLYLKCGSGSVFDVYPGGSDNDQFSLGVGSRLVEVVDVDNTEGGRLACVSASDYKHGHYLSVWMDQHVDEDQQTSRDTITLYSSICYFDVESTPTASSSHGDSELFKISLRPRNSEVKEGFTRYKDLKFASEQQLPEHSQ